MVSPLAGLPVPASLVVDLAKLEAAYYAVKPDAGDAGQRVSFGTSGHRGTSVNGTFNEGHILAIAQAICEYRKGKGIDGPLMMGKDTHALSGPAERTALEVFAGNGVTVWVQEGDGFTPTPVVSHAILTFNGGRNAGGGTGTTGLADGVIITPSHNPPGDGGFKYNPPNGGPADTDITNWIQGRANELMKGGNAGVKRMGLAAAMGAGTTVQHDFVMPYVRDLGSVIDMEAIRGARVKIGVDPLGGAAVGYWEPIKAVYGLDLTVVNAGVDKTFKFMMVDHDGQVRMDCSSPWAMAGLVKLKDRFGIAFANDPDADRHGIVTPSAGLMNPNHFLAVAIEYLLGHRPAWGVGSAVGKTLVSSGMIDRVVGRLKRKLMEVPVGFKWFSPGLFDGSCCFGGEESAGASFLRRDGSVWTTDKDGPIMGLLAAEILAVTGKDPGEHYARLTGEFGTAYYTRLDAAATPAEKERLKGLSPADVKAGTLAGEAITAKLTRAPGNGAAVGGLKVTAANGWFAARPSGTENIYKIYAESFLGEEHLGRIVAEAKGMVGEVLAG